VLLPRFERLREGVHEQDRIGQRCAFALFECGFFPLAPVRQIGEVGLQHGLAHRDRLPRTRHVLRDGAAHAAQWHHVAG